MQEAVRPPRETTGFGPGGPTDLLPPDGGGTIVTVGHGHYCEQLPVSGMTVGEVRARYRDRFDIDPRSEGLVDGTHVPETTRLRAGQMLLFMKRSGEKGAGGTAPQPTPDGSEDAGDAGSFSFPFELDLFSEGGLPALEILRRRRAARAARAPEITSVLIEGNVAKVTTREGKTASMSVADLVAALAPPRVETGDVVLPDGIKAARSRGPLTVWVHQTPPRVFELKWIAADSPEVFGKGAKYRTVRIALPYLIVMAVFTRGRGGRYFLSQANECFFRVRPLTSLSDDLCYPALLNCSKFNHTMGRPLSWICTQHLDSSAISAEQDPAERVRLGLAALLRCLLETGFNYSSEVHEMSSWFTQSIGVDPRIATIEAWEAATRGNPLFALDVAWLPVGHTVGQVIDRIFDNHNAGTREAATANDVGRIILNAQRG